MDEFGLGITVLSLLIWLVLLFGRGQFWRSDQFLDEERNRRQKAEGRRQKAGEAEEARGKTSELKTLPLPTLHSPLPSICAIIPARNEADLLPATLRSLLMQDYANFQIVLVDDHSTDGTAAVARQTAQALEQASKLVVVSAEPLPAGWTGKLWAMEQGIRYAQTLSPQPDYFLLTDADIEHHPEKLHQLVAKALADDLDLVSLMVLLRCKSTWETLLIPAFIFFFQKLYPFRWANDPRRKLAAAAGGCILIRREALEQIGGLQILRQALIDDCSLAQAVKGLSRRQEAGGRGQKDREAGEETSASHTPPPPPTPTPHTLHPSSHRQNLAGTHPRNSQSPSLPIAENNLGYGGSYGVYPVVLFASLTIGDTCGHDGDLSSAAS
ncbi:MAG: glycosyltransferase [Leptolyngbya sp. BL-A-14]